MFHNTQVDPDRQEERLPNEQQKQCWEAEMKRKDVTVSLEKQVMKEERCKENKKRTSSQNVLVHIFGEVSCNYCNPVGPSNKAP